MRNAPAAAPLGGIHRIASFLGAGLPILALTFVSLLFVHPVEAADPQPYAVRIDKTGNSDLDDAMQKVTLLKTLRKNAPVDPFALVARASSDIPRMQAVLESFGYYQAQESITIAARALSDPNLITYLDSVPAGQSVPVYVAIKTGPLYHLRHVTIDGAVPKEAADKLQLQEGQPAVAADVLAASTRLLTALQENGYALAKVDQPDAVADDQAHVIDVTFKAETGPRTNIGEISITGTGAPDVDEDVIRRAIRVKTGDLYRPSKIEEARKSILALGAFSGVEARASDKLDSEGRVPLTFDVSQRPRHAVTLTGAYSTDLGFSAGVNWSDRNLFDGAEQLNLSAAINGVGGTASSALGYNLTAQFLKPEFYARDQTLEVDIGAIKQKLDAYDQTAETVAVLARRKFSKLWSGSVGLSVEQDDITQETVKRVYQLVSVPFAVTYDSTGIESLLQEATRGGRARFSITPTESFGRHSSTFVTLQAQGSAYVDLFDLGIEKPTDGVFAFRALIASVQGAGQFDLPPDRRLYAGGTDTVRGYRYQSIGPLFPDKKPIGATAVDAATVEFRQHLFDQFGAAAFIDVGQASATGVPFSGTPRAGAGLGVRYYTPIGPVRVDVALPLTPIPGGDSFEVYIGLGQAF
jgi:translocation and assembly module TamA